MNIEIECQECKNIFVTEFKHREKKFCGRTCYFNFARRNKTLGKLKDESVREERNCVQCGKVFTERIKHDKKICSKECRELWNSNPENKKNRIEKSKKVLEEKYGVDSIFKLDSFKKNKKEIFIKKYGVHHPMHVLNFVEKLKTTIKEKHLLKLLPKLENNSLSLNDEYTVNKNGNSSKPYNFKCLKCENTFTSTLLGSGKLPICRKCYPINKNSKLEEIIKDFLNEKNVKFINNDRSVLNGNEIDILIPEHKIGIEIHGNYFHSENHGGKDKNYHLNKTRSSNNKDIKLIQIFEDEILLRREITLSRISNLLKINQKIYGRNCEIKEISKKNSSTFLNKNHIQGDSVDKFRYGLYYNDELVGVMTFGKKRKVLGNKEINDNEFELLRFSNKINTNIIGGFSKLLNFFIKKESPKKIITYADIRWSGIDPEKTVYYKNNFTFIKITPPNYWYIDTKHFLNRYHRFTYRKDVLVKEGYSNEKTEWEIMQEKKFDRIWDCGSMKFELILK